MVADPLLITTGAELAEFLARHDEEQLREVLASVGIPDILRVVFAVSAAVYRPETGPAEAALVRWEIQDPDRGSHAWCMTASRDGLQADPEAKAEPDVTLRTDVMTFLRLMARDIRGIEALSSGKLELDGDIQLALEMEGWFAAPSEPAREG
jgi:predicted lipid carrier protein YhbT